MIGTFFNYIENIRKIYKSCFSNHISYNLNFKNKNIKPSNIRFIKFLSLIFFLIFNCFHLLSQNYFSLKVDNDLFFGTDRYYTSGIFLKYGNLISIDSLISNKKITTKHYTIGQKINAPSLRYTEVFDKIDYPYNGWLFFEYNKKTFYSNFNGYSIGFQIGTTGDYESLSKPMQNLYHKYILDLPVLPWTGHQPQSFHINFFSKYYSRIMIFNQAVLLNQSEIYFGTYESFFGTRFGLQFGNLNYHAFFNKFYLNPNNTFSFYLGNKIEYGFHRYEFSGSLFRNNSLFKYDYLKLINKIEIGLLYNINNWQLNAIVNSRNKDFKVQRYNRHTYLTLNISKTF